MATETDLRHDIIEACRDLVAKGLVQGTAGNVSARLGDRMLITPSAIPYEDMTPDLVACMDLSGDMDGGWEGPAKPSTEWRFHWKLLRERPDISSVVHAHPPYCTALAILRRPIPACHYMVAAFGGSDVPCCGFETFGTAALADMVVETMQDRTACLMANHGMIACGAGLAQAMWRAQELETLAQQYCLASQLGDPVILSEEAIQTTLKAFSGYGVGGDS